jgi:hypothetical protein
VRPASVKSASCKDVLHSTQKFGYVFLFVCMYLWPIL